METGLQAVRGLGDGDRAVRCFERAGKWLCAGMELARWSERGVVPRVVVCGDGACALAGEWGCELV